MVPEDLIPSAPVLSVEDALKSFKIADGFVIEAVASEPLVEKPVAMAFDEDGRMWVVEMRGFMGDLDGKGEDQRDGKVVVLEDTDNDGVADTRTVFADGLHLPRAVALVEEGALIADNSALYFCGRDGVKRTSELTMVDPEYAPGGNVEHRSNGMMRHLNNWYYNTKSDQRYRWEDGELEKDKTEFRGQWGISMDDFGRIYHTTNSVVLIGDRLLPDVLDPFPKARFKPETSVNLSSSRVYPVRVNPGVNRAYVSKKNGYEGDTLDPETFRLISATAVAGVGIYRGDNFPESWDGIAFSCESVANLVKAVRVKSEGLELEGSHVLEGSEFLASTDERFRPVNIYTAPDGSLYLIDMYHGPIQHKTYMTSYLRDQYESRGLDKPAYGHGRIYRIRSSSNELGNEPRLSRASSEELVGYLSHANGWWRDTAQRLLVERNETASVPLLRKVLTDSESRVARSHALWTLAGINELRASDIEALLESDQPEGLLIHALSSALELPVDRRATLRSSAARLVGEGMATNPYALRLLASLPLQYSEELVTILPEVKDEPFAVEAVATGLLSQDLTEFPETGTKVNRYLEAVVGNMAVLAVEERLSSDALASFQRGKELYNGLAACVGCHGADGGGLPSLGPPLDSSEWVNGSPERLAKILLHGLQGPITVAGIKYEPLAVMPGLVANPTMTDTDLADVMTYIRSEWSNTAGVVPDDFVGEVRKNTRERNGRMYTVRELEESQSSK